MRCANRKHDMQQGVICGLTGAKPTFLLQCSEYSYDPTTEKVTFDGGVRPNDQRAKLAMLMVGIVMLLDIVSFYSDYLQYSLLTAFQAGESVTDEMLTSNDSRQQVVGIVSLIFYVISGITFIQWFRRGYYNLHQRIKTCNHTDGWAAGAWFVPIVCLYRPYQIMREMWVETALVLKRKNEDYMPSENLTLIGIWWTIWIISSFLGNIIFRTSFRTETVDGLMNSTVASMVLSVLGIPLALVTIAIIKKYDQMEQMFDSKQA